MEKIGLFGGTFDPPHIGHVKLAETVLRALELDEVWFIPTYQPPHKQNAAADPNSRLEMLRLILKDQENFNISTIEYELKGKSYTYHTMVKLKEQYPSAQFYFIIGGDMVDYLPNWYRIQDLKKVVKFVGVTRKEYEDVRDENVLMVEMEDMPISSTEIRHQLKKGNQPEGLSEDVLQYIRENHLYEN
ncbi:putative nicotinate-nucleotide adenylyltransferase [Tenuibacillus multivorans]|nr:nicotinate-nucleotide adenylyltransferase [Tenuibacillus multivorans]GEL77521.1 putative nicotinate-nucleotide adenylyltransferase [Tenuibacillus multivorans]